MPWFSDWFNSPYYHILYKTRDDDEGRIFIDNLDRLLHFDASHKILDLACGRGRHAVYLNAKGYDVLGIDLSLENINAAQMHANTRLRFQVGDMREPAGQSSFDFVFNLFTSFGYFRNDEDNFKTIDAISKGLKQGGYLVLDFFNTTKVLREMVPYEVKSIEDIDFKIHKRLEGGYIIKTIQFTDKGQAYHFEEKVRALHLSDFERYFHHAGLQILYTYGDYALAAYDMDLSDRLILIAKKP